MAALKTRKRAKSLDSGMAMVEFALGITIFLTMMFAVFDFGYFYYVKVTLQNAVRQAGRYAVTGSCTGGTNCFGTGTANRYNSILQVALNYSFGLITTSQISVTCLPPPIGLTNGCPAWAGAAGGPGDVVRMTATYTWHPITALIAKYFTAGAYTFTVSSTFKNETFPPPPPS